MIAEAISIPLIPIGAFLSLIGLTFVATLSLLVRRNRRFADKIFSEKILVDKGFSHKSKNPYVILHKFLFPKAMAYEALLFITTATVQALRIILFLLIFSLYFEHISPADYLVTLSWREPQLIISFLVFILALLMILILCVELLPRIWIENNSASAMRTSQWASTLFLIFMLPITYPLYFIFRLISPKKILLPLSDVRLASPERLIDFIQDGVEANVLTEHDKTLLLSVLHFRDRIVREVMVPRVDLFCLSSETTIQAAAALIYKEGYSRVPVYKSSIDKIVGVLMFKDILHKYMEITKSGNLTLLREPIESLVKEVLYTPETKSLSQLLQEFRKRKVHIAIVVDEYGGTSGLVTIEDILEEIVGEIGDEYDEEEPLVVRCGKNAWLVGAKMNLLDLEEELGIKIPEEGDYDTIAGYIFYKSGTIPEKGVIIHHDDFDIEIVARSERSVEKVKIRKEHAEEKK